MNEPDEKRWIGSVFAAVITTALAVVIIAPIALSSQYLVSWAGSDTGLGLSGVWPYVVFIALDFAAVLCIFVAVYSSWRGESGGAAHLLVWVFAGSSAFANFRHAARLDAVDAVWFFPAMSILGVVLLEVVIRKIRRWARSVNGAYEPPLPSFRVLRWIVARRETYAAWKFAVVEGISTPREAVNAVRGEVVPVKSVQSGSDVNSMSKADAIRFAFGDIGAYDVPRALEWLSERGVTVARSHAHNVAKSEMNSRNGNGAAIEVTQ